MPRTSLLAVLLALPSSLLAQWRVVQTKDEINDELRTVFLVQSSNTVPNSIRVPIRATLAIRCSGGSFTDLYVVTGGYVGDEVKVQYRLDGGDPQEETWEGGRAKDALFFQSSAPVAAEALRELTILGIISSKRFVFRWYPPLEDARTATFAVAGFALLPKNQLKVCGRDRMTLAAGAREQARQESAKAMRARLTDSLQTRDSTLPWVAERGGIHYWRNVTGCPRTESIPVAARVYLRTDKDAEQIGYARAIMDPRC